jgi:hypothetical protein
MWLSSLQSYELAPPKRMTLLEIKTVLVTLRGRLGPCHIYSISNPQCSDFLFEVLANSKGSLPQSQFGANQMPNKQ